MDSPCNILGIISGSSLDGLDIALCTFNGMPSDADNWSILQTKTVLFPEELIPQLRIATNISSRELMKLEVAFSKFCGQACIDFIEQANERVDYISSHGHTVFHYPGDGYTLQIGKGSIITEMTGIPCIVDLRANDVALEGQGAPVAPIVEKYLYPGYDVYFNLGGIANFSVHHNNIIQSIDSCPCNQVLNYLIGQQGFLYDDKGQVARSGSVRGELIEAWSCLEYFKLPAPKSMDNSWVKEIFIPILDRFECTVEDGLATMVEFCAIQLTKDITSIEGYNPTQEHCGFVTGGGAYNNFLIERMTEHFKDIQLKIELPSPETIEFKEAILIALMGHLRVLEVPNTISTVTGASKASIGGAIYLSKP